MKHVIPTDLLNKILNYLSTKPFGEVFEMITQVQTQATIFNLSSPIEAITPKEDENCDSE